MDGSVSLGRAERKQLLEWYRRSSDPAVRLRSHIVLLLADGHSWSLICAMLYCSTRTIARWRRRFAREGLEAITTETRGRRPVFGGWIVSVVVRWVTKRSPRDFGFVRSRWCCGAVVRLLAEVYREKVSRETVRRWLHARNLVWRRPRPVLKPKDPRRTEKLRKLRSLLANLAADEIAVFEDEVDVNLNPKIGCMWMERGAQAVVETPGTNQKRYLAGSLNWRTGELIATEGLPGEGRNSVLFVRHLDELRRRLRRYRVIHVICDNAKFHDCRRVHEYLAVHGNRIRLHFLPAWAPETNPIERIWWHLHEEITRNHRCESMDELLDLVFEWLDRRHRFVVERDVYEQKRAA